MKFAISVTSVLVLPAAHSGLGAKREAGWEGASGRDKQELAASAHSSLAPALFGR
jgi:hypothetical protein